MKIKNRILKTEFVKWRDLEWFQPKELKSLDENETEKLKNSLTKNDFIQPFNIWQKGKKLLILDGHHRQLVMKVLEDEGHIFPDLLPANFINVKNEKEAKKLVLLYSSQYAKIIKSELELFIEDIDSIIDDVEIPFIDVESFTQEEIGNFEEKEISLVDVELKNKCPKCSYEY